MPVRSFYWGICVTEFPGRLKDSDTVILEWKIALGNIMRAAHEGDLETIKQQGSILTDTNRPGDRCATAGPNQGESQ
jgi:hypothetical protein